MIGLDVLSRIASDYSNLDEIVQEIDTLQLRSNSEKEYRSLKKQVTNLEGNFKKRAVSLLSAITDDLSNLNEIRAQILELVDQYNKDIDNKNRFESLKQQVANLEDDFKTQGEEILRGINDDFSNLEEIENQVAVIKAKNAKRLA